MVQLIPLNGVGTCIRRGAKYLKSGATVQGPRRDARPGALRSLLTVGPKGHVHIRRARSCSAAEPAQGRVTVWWAAAVSVWLQRADRAVLLSLWLSGPVATLLQHYAFLPCQATASLVQ